MKDVEIKRQRFSLDVYNQWSGLLGSNNWTDFTIITIEVEDAPYKGSFEVVLGLIGFVLTFTYTYNYDFVDKLMNLSDEIMADLEDKHPGMEIIDPLGVLKDLDKK